MLAFRATKWKRRKLLPPVDGLVTPAVGPKLKGRIAESVLFVSVAFLLPALGAI